MKNSGNGRTVLLVLGTWALVLVSLYSTCEVKRSYNEQLKETRRSTELAWRPFLHIGSFDHHFDLIYRLGETSEADTLPRRLADVPLDSPEYLAVKNIGFMFTRRTKFKNTGATPLRITHEIVSTLSQNEWEETYGKSAENLATAIHSFEEYVPLETDITIVPGDSVTGDKPQGSRRRMEKTLFERYLESDSLLIFYPYIYVEYEDFFGHQYNALYMEHVPVRLRLENQFIVYPDEAVSRLERYRWDLEIPAE
jgi:hypothetical protein